MINWKILQVALGEQRDLQEALLTVGDVIYWDWSHQERSFNEIILDMAQRHKPNLIFLQLQAPGIISERTAAKLQENALVFNWTGDVRTPTPKWYFDIGRHIYCSLFTNMEDVKQLKAKNIRAGYLQIGLPDKIFTPDGPERAEADIIFMGNNYGGFPLSVMRHELVKLLSKRYGARFKAFGTGWPGYHPENRQAEEAAIYRGAKLGINLSHFCYPRYSSDRLLRIMGSGCMALTHKFPDIEEEYEIGRHLDSWENFNQLTGRIDYYLEHESERQEIARQGCGHVHKYHTWANRMEDLKNFLF